MLNAYFKYSYGGDIYNKTLVDKVENVDPLKNADSGCCTIVGKMSVISQI